LDTDMYIDRAIIEDSRELAKSYSVDIGVPLLWIIHHYPSLIISYFRKRSGSLFP
jgi:hypothetical protein